MRPPTTHTSSNPCVWAPHRRREARGWLERREGPLWKFLRKLAQRVDMDSNLKFNPNDIFKVMLIVSLQTSNVYFQIVQRLYCSMCFLCFLIVLRYDLITCLRFSNVFYSRNTCSMIINKCFYSL